MHPILVVVNCQNIWMGGMATGKCEGTQTNCKYFQGGYGGLQFGYVYMCNGFL